MKIKTLFILSGGVVMDYEELENKPSINGTTLEGDLELEDIGISELTPDMVSEIFLEVFGAIL